MKNEETDYSKTMMWLVHSCLQDLADLSDTNTLEANIDSDTDEDDLFKLRKTVRYVTSILHKVEEALQKQNTDFEYEYQLAMECISLMVDIQNEVLKIHNFIRDKYGAKFPELESIVHQPMDYARVVKRIGNEMDLAVVDLVGILPSASIMVVSITASNTNGKPLSEEKLRKTLEACDCVLALDDDKKKLLDFVERKMCYIAPNLSAVVGTAVAAKLMATAGGLSELAKMTDSTVQLLGANKKNLHGFSSQLRIGYIEETDLFQTTPPSLKTYVCRLIAGKSSLAAKIDSASGDPTGERGRNYREVIQKKIAQRLEEKQKGKQTNPLPVPRLEKKKNRGGRRHRKAKERYAVTEMRKLANRMPFGVPEDSSFGTLGMDFGMLGPAGNGRLRASVGQNKLGVKVAMFK